MPENQRMACLKYILKKEIQSWDDKNENEDEIKNENEIESSPTKDDHTNKIDGKEVENKVEKSIDIKKVAPKLKRLLSRREKITETVEEEIKEKIVAKIEQKSSSSSSFPSHYSPFPSASATLSSTTSFSTSSRPFQAVIFADDEELATSVCETVKILLEQKGNNITKFTSLKQNNFICFSKSWQYENMMTTSKQFDI